MIDSSLSAARNNNADVVSTGDTGIRIVAHAFFSITPASSVTMWTVFADCYHRRALLFAPNRRTAAAAAVTIHMCVYDAQTHLSDFLTENGFSVYVVCVTRPPTSTAFQPVRVYDDYDDTERLIFTYVLRYAFLFFAAVSPFPPVTVLVLS